MSLDAERHDALVAARAEAVAIREQLAKVEAERDEAQKLAEERGEGVWIMGERAAAIRAELKAAEVRAKAAEAETARIREEAARLCDEAAAYFDRTTGHYDREQAAGSYRFTASCIRKLICKAPARAALSQIQNDGGEA